MKSYFKLGKIEREIFNEVSFGDILIGHLLSGASSYRANKIMRERVNNKMKYKRSIQSLKKKNIIATKNDLISLTKFEKKILQEREVVTKTKNIKKKWDGEWRMIAFDIPQTASDVRYFLRNFLLNSGFVDIQQSVYFFPFYPKELIKFLEDNPELGKYIIFAEISKCSFDKRLRKEFNDLI